MRRRGEPSMGRGQASDAEKEEPKAFRDRRGENKVEDERMGSESDDEDLQARKYRDDWIAMWGFLGKFEDTTRIPAMRFTDNHPPSYDLLPCTTVQVFSAKIAELRGGLQFPLSVYGVIAARDCAEPRRNIIFSRTRDNCQTITDEDRYLVLTGPSRAIVLLDPLSIEVMLKVKGAVECEDKTLNFQAIELKLFSLMESRVMYGSYISKLSTLELTLGSIVSSVEATLSVQVINGSLPGYFSVIARTSSCEDTDQIAFLLVGSRGMTMPVSGDGQIKLSRSVVSVPVRGKLVISLSIFNPSKKKAESGEVDFVARRAGKSSSQLQLSSCTMEITAVWSPVSLLE